MIAENEPRRHRRNAGNGPPEKTNEEDVRHESGDSPRPETRPPEKIKIKLRELRQALEEGEKSGVADYSLNSLIRELDEESMTK